MTIDTSTLGGWIFGVLSIVFASQGFWTWVSSKTSKSDNENVLKKFTELDNKINELDKKIDDRFNKANAKTEEIEAKNMRARILRFNTECMDKRKHTTEDFIEILHIITNYKNYCKAHDEFENERANLAIKNITEIWSQCQAGYDSVYLFK